MKKTTLFGMLVATLLTLAAHVSAQVTPGMEVKEQNLTTFSLPVVNVTNELQVLTSTDGQTHPEYGILPPNAPCTDCIELVEKREVNKRFYSVGGSYGTHFWEQTANGPLHFENSDGHLVSYDGRLKQTELLKYESRNQDTPTELNIGSTYTAFHLTDEVQLTCNNLLQLIHKDASGVEHDIGYADWSDRTVGDDGMYVYNAWSGIDLVIYFDKDQIKSNIIVKSELPYSGGHLIVRDHLDIPDGYTLAYEADGDMGEVGWKGAFALYPLDAASDRVFTWKPAIVFDAHTVTIEEKLDTTIVTNIHRQTGEYVLDTVSGTLDLYVSMDWLTTPERQYPITIDPLVTSSATSAVLYKFRINGEFCAGATYCSNTLTVALPSNATLTAASFSLVYVTVPGACAFSCWMSDAGFRIWSSVCGTFSPPPPFFWSCVPPAGNAPGTCSGLNLGIFNLVSCLAPVCDGTIDFEVRTSYCYCNVNGTCPAGAAVPCQTIAAGAFTVNIEGHTLEVPSNAVTVVTSCCAPTTLNPNPSYGVGPYTYAWSTGETTPTISVAHCANTAVWPYSATCTVTDACGVTQTVVFTLSITDCGVLPIELVDFSGEWNEEGYVLLEWETLSESNNDYYSLSYSQNGTDWTLLTTVSGAGSSTTQKNYEYRDRSARRGINYYKLSQTDFDGTTIDVGVISVLVYAGTKVDIYPNPAKNTLRVETNMPDSYVAISDIAGRHVLPIASAESSQELDITGLAPGIYFVHVMNERTRIVEKFMKE